MEVLSIVAISADKMEELLEDYAKSRGVQKSTIKGVQSAVLAYLEFVGRTSFQEMVEEAIADEKKGVASKERKLKSYLIDWRLWLKEKSGLGTRTCKTYISKIMSLYRHYEVEVPNLPAFKWPNDKQTTYFDLPTKDHIREAVNDEDILLKAIILFMSSSGTAKAETLNLTVGDWVDGCREYYDEDLTDISKIIAALDEVDEIVPILYCHRIKTDKYYYTCCSPEASRAINMMLKIRSNEDKLKRDDQLFDITNSMMLHDFQRINDEHGWGRVGNYRFFRSHALRKYFASNIQLTPDLIDAFEGRSKNSVHETYIKTDPKELKKIYVSAMHRVMIYDDENKESTVAKKRETKRKYYLPHNPGDSWHPEISIKPEGEEIKVDMSFKVANDELNDLFAVIHEIF